MTADLEFTGERFVPGVTGAIAYEHGHRYAFAQRYANGRRVLDAACGEGYGAAQLAQVAASVCGVDISEDSIRHAREKYAGQRGVRFETASVTALPIPDRTIDVVVSFETIEHLPQEDQPKMLAEFARVLTNDGLLVLSSPNRRLYSDARDYRNPFHLHELYRDELAALLDAAFPARRWYHQVPIMASAVWSEEQGPEVEAWVGDGQAVARAAIPDGVYYVVVAAKTAAALPPPRPALSLFHDANDSELARADAAQSEVLRLDGILRDRDAQLTEHAEHVRHLEELVAYRERIVVTRDAEIAALQHAAEKQAQDFMALQAAATHREAELSNALAAATARAHAAEERAADAEARVLRSEDERRRLEASLAAQERIIAYRQSFRWWLRLPLVRTQWWWQRTMGS